MRETLKSLSIFSAMLLLLLLISTGCNVNIPGCGKRSLPFFRAVNNQQAPNTSSNSAPSQLASNNPAPTEPKSIYNNTTAATNNPIKQTDLQSSLDLSTSNQKTSLNITPTPTFTPEDVEKFAFTTVEEGKPTLWTMNIDGTNRVRMTKVGTSSYYPLWSPNGKMLAFLSDQNEGKTNLYLMPKGSNQMQQITFFQDLSISNSTKIKTPYSWSPKGDEIAFLYHNQIWKIEVDASAQESIVGVDPNFSISAIEWAPHRENTYVAYLVQKGINYFSLNLSNPRLKDNLKLMESSVALSDMSWSADARDVVFISDSSVIYSCSAQTSLPKILLSLSTPLLGPLVTFCPSESLKSLLVLAKQDPAESGYRVAIVNTYASDKDSGSLKYLTEPGVDDAIWSPNGAKIAYLQSGELWVMDSPTGSNKLRIAATGIQSPCWSKK